MSVVSALSEDQVARVTGLSVGQLRAWDKRGFFVPTHAYDDRRSAYSRIYSFKDVVGLQTIRTLREAYGISFPKLRTVAAELERRGFNHWADTRLYVIGKSVYFKHLDSDRIESVENGQLAMLPVIEVINEVARKVEDIRFRSPERIGGIERNRFVGRNSWMIAGTRIPTAAIRRYRDAGYTDMQILEEYPSLTLEDVQSALHHEDKLASTG